MSNKSNARHSMELALTYLSRCEVNEGLNPRWTERAMKVTSDWKKKFTKYLVGKPQVWGCPEPGKAHTEETAKDLADRLIVRYYEEEKAARLEEPTTKWSAGSQIPLYSTAWSLGWMLLSLIQMGLLPWRNLSMKETVISRSRSLTGVSVGKRWQN